VSAVAQLARRAKKDLPADLVAAGSVQGNFAVKEDGPAPADWSFTVAARLPIFACSRRTPKRNSLQGTYRSFCAPTAASTLAPSQRKSVRHFHDEILPAPDELRVEYGPFPVALGRPVPAQARGWVGGRAMAWFYVEMGMCRTPYD
jgi:hypothetical protein